MPEKVGKIKYTVIKESDISEKSIFAFRYRNDIAFLCRKNSQFFWKSLSAVDEVWYQMYEKIEQAIEGVRKVDEYKIAKKKGECGEILEFDSLIDFIEWAYTEFIEESEDAGK